MIKRSSVDGDERQKNIALTEKGRALSSQSVEITDKVLCATGLSLQQADEMIALCQRVTGFAKDS